MVKQKYIQFYDINTDPDKVSAFVVRAGGEDVHRRLSPFFQAYKYYKLGPVKVKCVPASTLPVDPTGLSYEAGDTTVDPRDQFNPGLIRIINGEPVGVGGGLDMNKYYATMLDPRWFKFRLQSGFTRSAVPLVWNVAENGQDILPGTRFIDGYNMKGYQHEWGNGSPYLAPIYVNSTAPTGTNLTMAAGGDVVKTTTNPVDVTAVAKNDPNTDAGRLYLDARSFNQNGSAHEVSVVTSYMLQNQRVRLGWMPTDIGPNNPYYHGALSVDRSGYTFVPEIELMEFILPKAFKTKFYYRFFVETTVYFRDPVVIDPLYTDDETDPITPFDRFGVPSRLENPIPEPDFHRGMII